MSRYAELLEKYLDHSETPEEGDELARLLGEDEQHGRELYDRVMLEADLYDSFAGISELQVVPPLQAFWKLRRIPIAAAAAAVFLLGLAGILFGGRWFRETPKAVVPAALPPKEEKKKDEEHLGEYKRGLTEVERLRAAGKTAEAEKLQRELDHERDEHLRETPREGRGSRDDSKRAEIEREYQKGLREVERKRAKGEQGEANEKLREIERERDKHLRELDRKKSGDD